MNEQDLIKIAQTEITLNKQDKELWKKCLTLTGNDVVKAKDKYARQRVIQLKKLDSIALLLLDQSLQVNTKDSQTQYSIPPEKEKITNSKTLLNPEPIVSAIESLKKELGQNEDINTTEDNADEKKWLGIPKIWFVSIITILILGWILSNSNSNTENKNNAKYKNQSTTVQTTNPSTNVYSGNIQTDTITEADCRIISGIISRSIMNGRYICEVQGRIYYISEKKTNIGTERRTKQYNISVDSNPTAQPQYSLVIKPNPVDATIKILNIGPKYYDGIVLSKGKYNIEVSKNGYETVSQWLNIEKNENIHINLTKKNINIDTKLPTNISNSTQINKQTIPADAQQ
ncbi:MAG: PEGA domain-containing protein, partial [Sulfurospirillaceae bacterium]|nr:PEGA domain-containing protein [Sulfurospirillaceae bacterium]